MCFSGACAASSTCDDDPIVDNFHVCTGAHSARTACVRRPPRRPRRPASNAAAHLLRFASPPPAPPPTALPLRSHHRRITPLLEVPEPLPSAIKRQSNTPRAAPVQADSLPRSPFSRDLPPPTPSADIRVHPVAVFVGELLGHVPGLEERFGAAKPKLRALWRTAAAPAMRLRGPARTQRRAGAAVRKKGGESDGRKAARDAPTHPLTVPAPSCRPVSEQWEGIPGIPEPVAGIGLRLGLGSLGALPATRYPPPLRPAPAPTPGRCCALETEADAGLLQEVSRRCAPLAAVLCGPPPPPLRAALTGGVGVTQGRYRGTEAIRRTPTRRGTS